VLVSEAHWLAPEWPAPRGVRSAFTLRSGGVSAGPYASLNVGTHVGDDMEAVMENRRRLRSWLELPAEPAWLEQVHGTDVVDLDAAAAGAHRGDAAITRSPARVCAIQVADCMPVLFTARDASAVGAAHAGWRGLAAGVLERTVGALRVAPRDLIAWMGPAIGPEHFEVGGEVRERFLAGDPDVAPAFEANARGRWQCDLAALVRRRLAGLGITAITGGAWCTYTDAQRFFSYRRDGTCGRLAALIWLQPG
jgi:YfiH family protein